MKPFKGLIDYITLNRKTFFFFVDYNKQYSPFGHGSLMYKSLIAYRQGKGIEELLDDDMFHTFMYGSLRDFKMDSRGARLARDKDMKASILSHKEMLIALYEHKLHTIKSMGDEGLDILSLLKKLFYNLQIMKTNRRIVGVSKALHFLLPDLVTPIDGNYTLTAIYGSNKQFKDVSEEFIEFREFFTRTYHIAKKLNLTPEDTNDERNRSIPKMIDNAIIGGVTCLEKLDEDDVDGFLSLIYKKDTFQT